MRSYHFSLNGSLFTIDFGPVSSARLQRNNSGNEQPLRAAPDPRGHATNLRSHWEMQRQLAERAPQGLTRGSGNREGLDWRERPR